MMAYSALPDPTRPKGRTRTRGRGPCLFFLFSFFFFESFQIIQIQLLFQTHFKYSMKIYIRKYHFNIKGAHHFITKLFFIRYGISYSFGPFLTFIQYDMISCFQYQNIYKMVLYKKSQINFIIHVTEFYLSSM